MSRPAGNTQLKAARQAAGFTSQQALADAMTGAALDLGLHGFQVSVRQVRRWESASPPWPQADHQRLLSHVLRLPIKDLGFRAPWDSKPAGDVRTAPEGVHVVTALAASLPRPTSSAVLRPPSTGTDYAAITTAHRRLYWTVQPAQLHQAIVEHANLGTKLLAETSGNARRVLAAALAESLLLAARIEFFDLRQADQADTTLIRALQAAGEADDALLGAAVLAHAAFVPGWAGRKDEAEERMVAARTYARRGPASAEFLAWLNAVEAECLTRCGDYRGALRLLARAEEALAADGEHSSPSWMDWFSPARLAAFKGNTQLKAGHLSQARATLRQVLADLPPDMGKQRAVVLADLAAVEATDQNLEQACKLAGEALDQLAATWYATGMERIRDLRRSLAPWQDMAAVRALDDRLYGWGTTLSALQR
ncbi:transcriptional regulator [Peterkaempfera bronchialis]|uniref:Transcriptional regulator n=1 Tax=Peterkaempfera bronchialis TaxID=2126346 RepID=A0A345SU97_9ACTN|nr:transcriptional regulator [Peterkaempfera bronchialis]AXI77302.1 transcriptional regulator [Peterkaempfera bronchialis]